jgi:hypothetical protein
LIDVLGPRGYYIPKLGYIVLCESKVEEHFELWYKCIWKFKSPLKLRIFMWLDLQDIRDNMELPTTHLQVKPKNVLILYRSIIHSLEKCHVILLWLEDKHGSTCMTLEWHAKEGEGKGKIDFDLFNSCVFLKQLYRNHES